jgi:RHS repeat-associated protein
MTDANGNIIWAADYLPFGQADLTVDTVENNLRFAGQYYDAETGLHYNYHRYYDPVVGRYLTPDPIGIEGGINPYAYVQNNPVIFIDPYGLAMSDILPSINKAVYSGYRAIGQIYDGVANQIREGQRIHFNRNQIFDNESITYERAVETWNDKVPPDYHQQGVGNEENKKFVSPDGHSEAIFDYMNNPVTDALNMPTYNRADPTSNPIGHTILDVIPYVIWGNSPDDPTSWYHRIAGTYKGPTPCSK